MFLARVIGQVVATRKDDAMSGRKMLVLRPLLVDETDPTQLRPGSNTVVAVDRLGAGVGQVVLFAQGSSARQAEGLKNCPVDAAVVGLVDNVDVLGQRVYSCRDSSE